MSSSDGSVIGGGPDAFDAVAPGGVGPARRRCRSKAPSRIYILLENIAGGLWSDAFPDEQPVGQGRDDTVRGMVIANVVSSEVGSATTSDLQDRLRSMALGQAQRATVQGFLEYEIQSSFRLLESIAMATGQTHERTASAATWVL